MDKVDQRVLRVGVEVDGEILWYEGLRITAKGDRAVTDTQNKCDVEISNLSRDVRNYLLTETSPFNKNRTPKRLFVEAGRVSTGVAQVFVGDIVSSSPTQPPDIGLRLKAQTGAFKKGELVARSGEAKEKLSVIAQRVADDLDADLIFEADDKFIANFSFSGAALRQVGALAQAGAIDAYQDNGTLVVKNRGAARRNVIKVVNLSTGMIGIPEATERGVRVKILYDLETDLGGLLRLTSELNPALDGDYTVYKMTFDLASRDLPFYWTLEASRNG